MSDTVQEKKETTSSVVPKKALSKLQQLQAAAKLTGEIVAKNHPEVKLGEKKSNTVPMGGAAPTTRRSRGSATEPIEKFSDDTKGIRVGSTVVFPERRGGLDKVQGTVKRMFKFVDEDREEARIEGPGGKRWYRFEKELELVKE
jgi:hypothetical protein